MYKSFVTLTGTSTVYRHILAVIITGCRNEVHVGLTVVQDIKNRQQMLINKIYVILFQATAITVTYGIEKSMRIFHI